MRISVTTLLVLTIEYKQNIAIFTLKCRCNDFALYTLLLQ